MTLNDILLLGGLITAVLAGILGIRRGDNLRGGVGAPPPFSLVGPTLADSVLMQKYIDATGRLADSTDKLAGAMNRIADGNEERKTDKIAEIMERLTDKLDEQERKPRR